MWPARITELTHEDYHLSSQASHATSTEKCPVLQHTLSQNRGLDQQHFCDKARTCCFLRPSRHIL